MQGLSIGNGVAIGDINSASHAVMEAAVLGSASEGGLISARLGSARQIENLFLPGSGTLQEHLDELFLKMERLSALPADASVRSAVVDSATNLAMELNRVSTTIGEIQSAGQQEVEQTVEQINTLASRVSELTTEITAIENVGQDAFGLRNERDALLRNLAELIDVERTVDSDGNETFVMGGGLYSINKGLVAMEIIADESGRLEVWREGCDEPHELSGGKLAGLLAAQNQPGGSTDLQEQLNEFTGALAELLDTSHATGVGINGRFTSLTGGRPVNDSSGALAAEETASQLTAGSLYVSITELSTGSSTLHEVSIDPGAQSLNDVAAAISAIPQLSAVADTGGRLSITSASGYEFDFTGNLQQHPDHSSLTGSASASVSGRYTGHENQELQFRFVGSGTVGVSDGLRLQVVDPSGATVRTVDIGREYEPGTELTIADGVSVSLTSGAVVDGESFTSKMVASPDETGLLAALGMNTLFFGSGPESIYVNPAIAENPSLFASTTNGDPADTRNLHRMLQLRDTPLLRDGTVTLEQYLSDLVAGVGQEASELARDIEGQQERHAFLQGELDAATGVDVNEELARMLQYQRSYQAAARYIATLDQTLQELMSIVG